MPSRSWIPLAQNVHTNARVIACARDLTGGDVDKMVGHLARLWSWALDHREIGDLSGIDATTIAEIMNWPCGPREVGHLSEQLRLDVEEGALAISEALASRQLASKKRHASRIRASLKAHGLLTEDDRIHDWMDYAGDLVKRRQKWREKQHLRRHGEASVSGTVSETNGTGVSETVSGTSQADRDRDRDQIPHTPKTGYDAEAHAERVIDEASEPWRSVLKHVYRATGSPSIVTMQLNESHLEERGPGRYAVLVSSQFRRVVLEPKGSLLRDALAAVTGRTDVELSIEVAPDV
jgi:hypothetical protein